MITAKNEALYRILSFAPAGKAHFYRLLGFEPAGTARMRENEL
jgi:hypothetical protein